jgi:hypothetical protein
MTVTSESTGVDRRYPLPFIAAALLCCIASSGIAAEGDTTFDGLVEVKSSNVQMAYLDPNADFSIYRRIAFLDPYVSFRKNWLRDQNRNAPRGSARVSEKDMERIKEDLGQLFLQVFRDRLEADNGYEVVSSVAEDVLIVRLAIIDLDVTSPDKSRSVAGSSMSFNSSAGAATLYMELYDSVSGDIIARAADRKVVRQPGGYVSWSNRVTNSAEARRLLGGWADLLRAFLDEHYKPGEALKARD